MGRRAATNTEVDREQLLDFARSRHHVVLTTRRGDGSPQSSPVTCGLDAEGRFVISTYPARAKAVNVRRESAVSLLVLSDDWDGP